MFPIEDADARTRVVYALRAMFRDNTKARRLGADGSYARVQPAAGETSFRVQQHLHDEARDRATRARDRAGVSFVPERRDEGPATPTRAS
jgi:polyphosphate kinase